MFKYLYFQHQRPVFSGLAVGPRHGLHRFANNAVNPNRQISGPRSKPVPPLSCDMPWRPASGGNFNVADCGTQRNLSGDDAAGHRNRQPVSARPIANAGIYQRVVSLPRHGRTSKIGEGKAPWRNRFVL